MGWRQLPLGLHRTTGPSGDIHPLQQQWVHASCRWWCLTGSPSPMLCWGFWWLAVPQQWVFNCFLQLLNPSLVVGQEGGGEMSLRCFVAQLWPSSTEGEHFCISILNLASFTSVFCFVFFFNALKILHHHFMCRGRESETRLAVLQTTKAQGHKEVVWDCFLPAECTGRVTGRGRGALNHNCPEQQCHSLHNSY